MLHLRLGSRVTAFLVLALAACDDPTSPHRIGLPSDSLTARPSIADGAHSGNAHFFFLPPMVSNPRYSGESDGTQSPTVVVCELKPESGDACAAIVAQFGRGDGTGTEEITYDAAAGQYQVNWKTDQCIDGPCSLDVSKTYRLRVLVGAYEVGHADLDVVSNGKELKNVATGEYVGLVDGRTLPIKFRIERGAVSVATEGVAVRIGAAGGVLTTADGMLSLDIPAGALTGETAITVSAVKEQLPGMGEWAPAIELGPDGTTFEKPVTLTMSFDGSKLPLGIPPSAIGLYTWKDGSWEPVAGSFVNVTDNTVTAPISHFSTYILTIAPNYMAGRPPSTLYYGDVTALSGYTVAYDISPSTYCWTVRVQKRILFWTRWVYETRCATVYTPYQYFPVGQRVYWKLQPVAAVPSPLDISGPLALSPFFDYRQYTVVGPEGATSSPFLTARAAGEQTLVASVQDGTVCIFGACFPHGADVWSSVITVLAPPVATVVVTPSAATLTLAPPGNTTRLSATLFDAQGSVLSSRGLTFSSTDPSVATVDLGSGLVTARGPGVTTIVATAEGKSGTATITVTGDGYTLAFSAMPLAGGLRNVFTQLSGAADASRVRITTGAVDDQSPRWSPNAQRFLFTSSRAGGGTWELYAQDANPAAIPRRITTAGGLTAYGDFSPIDPSMVVFMRSYRIWTMNIDAPNPEATAVQLTRGAFDEGYPRWSPDGRWIAFARQPRAGTDIWVMNVVDPTQAFQVTDLGDYARSPSWSPDGTKIVFSRLYDIYVADVIDNSNPANPTVRPLASVRVTRLTFDGDYNDGPVWSPDGRKIAWSKGGAQHDLFLMNVDGTGVERITSTPDIHEDWPAFKPR
jgi:hypothetical protein